MRAIELVVAVCASAVRGAPRLAAPRPCNRPGVIPGDPALVSHLFGLWAALVLVMVGLSVASARPRAGKDFSEHMARSGLGRPAPAEGGPRSGGASA